MLDEITIRPAEPRDADAIAAMTRRLAVDDPVERDPAGFAAYFERPVPIGDAGDHGEGDRDEDRAETFVACGPDDTPLAYLVMRPEAEYFTGERRAYIDHLAVAEGAEGRGLGRLLLTEAERWAHAHDCAVLSLDVFASNERARLLYSRAGFREDFIRMVRRLPDTD